MTTATMTSKNHAKRAQPRAFDGVICFGGEDWWYHNRGHYDMQIMRELSRFVPVLYINSIGMRMPRVSEGGMFLKRISRKLESINRGAVQVRPNFAVCSPFAVPGVRGRRVTRELLPRQVRSVARSMGISKPLLWVACPPAREAIDRIDAAGLVYQRTDRFEAFHNVNFEQVSRDDRDLKSRSDLTLFCSSALCEEERDDCHNALFVDHGVDFDRFETAGRTRCEPDDVREIHRPRVGFVGGIDAHTFGPELFNEVVSRLPDCNFVMVGGCTFPAGWCDAPNVHLLGQRDYQDVADYMAACDVLVMPWNDSAWIRACNPVKLKEYLAVGRPIVSTWFYEIERYRELVRIATNADDFAAAIRAALEASFDPAPGRARVREQTWTHKARDVLEALAAQGIVMQGDGAQTSPAPGGLERADAPLHAAS